MSFSPLGNFGVVHQWTAALAGSREAIGGTASKPATSPYFDDWSASGASPRGDHYTSTSTDWNAFGGSWTPASGPTGGGKVPKPSVIQMPSPNQNSRDGAKIDTIVLHHTAGAGTAQDVGRFFQNSANQVSSHYIVGKDGTIVQPVADDRRAWHAGESVFKGRGDVNDFSIGIEIVNRGDGNDPYTEDQYRALAKLVAFLQSEYGIPRDRITGHKDIAIPFGRKVDPSRNFSYEKLNKYVDEIMGGKQPGPAPAPHPTPSPSPAPAPNPGHGGTYTVRKGDSLSAIAGRVLGSKDRWREIYDLNRDQIRDPNLIFPGQVLKLPGKPKPEPKPEPKPPAPAPAPQPPAPAPQPQPGQLTPQQRQQLMALQQQLAAIEAQLTALMYQYYGYRG